MPSMGLAYNQDYYQRNKDRLSTLNNKKVTCQCGLLYVKSHFRRHVNSQKHILLMNLIHKLDPPKQDSLYDIIVKKYNAL